MDFGSFHLPGKKQLVRGFARPTEMVIDVTESPMERTVLRQLYYYFGKKKDNTLKCQELINQETGGILCLYCDKGRRYNSQLFKASGVFGIISAVA